MVREDEAWWCHGVEPGGITAHGQGTGMAFAAFKATLGDVLADMACDVADFQAFRHAVQDFLAAADSTEAQRWEAAREAMRAGAEVDWTFERVRREPGEWPIFVTVEELDHVATGHEDVALAQFERVA